MDGWRGPEGEMKLKVFRFSLFLPLFFLFVLFVRHEKESVEKSEKLDFIIEHKFEIVRMTTPKMISSKSFIS